MGELVSWFPDIAECMATALRGASFPSGATRVDHPMSATFELRAP